MWVRTLRILSLKYGRDCVGYSALISDGWAVVNILWLRLGLCIPQVDSNHPDATNLHYETTWKGIPANFLEGLHQGPLL